MVGHQPNWPVVPATSMLPHDGDNVILCNIKHFKQDVLLLYTSSNGQFHNHNRVESHIIQHVHHLIKLTCSYMSASGHYNNWINSITIIREIHTHLSKIIV